MRSARSRCPTSADDVRGYRDADRDACRALWVELTQTHRDLYAAPEIGGDDPGSYFDEHLELVGPENVWVAERDGHVVGFTRAAGPVGRNSEAIGFFHSRGFGAVGQIELILDLVDPGRWRAGERFAGRDFRV